MMNALLKRLKKPIARFGLYRLAYGLYETYRLVARPHTHGALVALWFEQRLLLVQTSYRTTLSLPGGGLEGRETPRQAAVRELAEELGLSAEPQQLVDPWRITEESPRGLNTVTIFALHAQRKPVITIDGLEIVGCHWLSREEALARSITSHLRNYLNHMA